MPKYRYNVINQENKSLSGTISAPDENSARAELSQLGFSIVGISQMTDEEFNTAPEETAQLTTFEFAAIDKNQKRVVGTIQSEDRFSAYRRLIQEYQFEVEYLIDSGLPEDKKAEEKAKGVFELQNRIDEEAQLAQQKIAGENVDLKEFERKQEVLKGQVEFVLKKVKEMLDLYEPEMKQETKAKIRALVDKILRIKSSTNLDYIRKSCEDLLTYLQKEELFLHEDIRTRERTQMVLEAKTMMMQLHRTKTSSNNGIFESLVEWRKKHILENERPSSGERFINLIISLFIGFVEENSEMKDLRHTIGVLNEQLKQYWLLYFQDPSPEFKTEARNSIKKLHQEKKKLINQLKILKKEFKKAQKLNGANTIWENFGLEVHSFTGWLLGFYLVYYFISIYLSSKQLNIGTFTTSFSIYHSTFLKYFLTTLFLFHASLAVKYNFFRRNDVATLFITPIFLLGTTLILLNF